MIDDARLDELSGLVSDGPVVWAMNDGGRRAEVHRLDLATCAVDDTRTSTLDPFDPEDLARGPDGSLWVGDIGDNERSRETVAAIVLPGRGEPRLHRLTYPDGPHDAEALLVDAEGRPVVVTKEVGRAGVYRTAEPPDGVGPTPLLLVGSATLPPSATVGGPLGSIGSRVVTGAAATADGRTVALRSYTDAWLYPVGDVDVVSALTGRPVQVPLPDEPQGEAITFRPDGALVSGSEARGGAPGEIRTVPGAAALGVEPSPTNPPSVAPEEPPPPTIAAPVDTRAWPPAVVGGVVAVGLLLVLTVALALRGGRRR